MALEKVETVESIEVVGKFKSVQVMRCIRVMEDGVAISESFERNVIHAGEDYSDQIEDVRAICDLVHTESVILSYNEHLNNL